MCPPVHYEIRYQINPWMDINTPVNRQKATEEHEALKLTFKDLGAEVLEMQQQKHLPDMVFAANVGHPQGNMFIKSNFKYKERREEAEIAKKYFQELGFIIKELPSDVIWEGQGDLLTVEGKYFLGWGKRSDYEAKKYLSEYLQADVIDLKLIDPYFYHLDVSLFPLNEKTAAINPRSFDKESLKKLYDSFENIIILEEEHNKNMACNGVVIGNTVVVPKNTSKSLEEEYRKHGFSVREVSMDEYKKSGGAVKCLTLEFF